MNTLLPFTDFLWILQKEEYESGRYLYWLKRFFFRRNFVVSEKLVYTTRAKVTLILAELLWVLTFTVFTVIFPHILVWALVLLILLVLTPLYVLLANLALSPLFAFAHARVRRRAQALVAAHAPMQVVAVVGSYGKTTTKHFLYELVRYQFLTQMTPGTVNTTTGIADWLARELLPKTELIILEMDAYHRGEIAASCLIAPPSIVILTNIGEQHLARFGTHEALRQALGEAVAYARSDAIVVADASTIEQVREFAGSRELLEVDTSRLAYGVIELAAPALSGSNRENLARALAVAARLGILPNFAKHTVEALALPERRQEVTNLHGYEGIDDSYNISLSTARAGLAAARALAAARGKKLVVVAAGIPELGPEQSDGNVEFGKALAASADHTIVLGTMFARAIERGLGEAPHTRYARLNDFLADAAKFPKEEWVLLLEPVLPDLYY
jgi:UDP-N-acetylmuramoyl-tripeptide--D-alanyl-D-alanine ligase